MPYKSIHGLVLLLTTWWRSFFKCMGVVTLSWWTKRSHTCKYLLIIITSGIDHQILQKSITITIIYCNTTSIARYCDIVTDLIVRITLFPGMVIRTLLFSQVMVSSIPTAYISNLTRHLGRS